MQFALVNELDLDHGNSQNSFGIKEEEKMNENFHKCLINQGLFIDDVI